MTNILSINSSFNLILSNNGIQIQSFQKNKLNQNSLSYIENTKEGFFYNSNFENKNFYERTYLICRTNDSFIDASDNDLKNEYYEINQGDILKLGRLYLKIREIVIEGNKINKESNNKNNILNRLIKSLTIKNQKNQNKKKLCRVCYSDEKEVNSPLISPCKCNGGLKYIHLSCLRNWIEAKAILKQNESNEGCLKYIINQVFCEICKEPYPDFIYIDEKQNFFEIFDFIQKKYKSYIIFETIPTNENNDNEDNSHERELFILSFDEKNSIFLGRSHSVDMKLNDITVSRCHCKIIINRNKNKYYLRDLGSKFGTEILIQNNKIKLNSNFPFYIQLSRNAVSISIQKTCNFICDLFSCCSSNNEEKIYKYYGQWNSEGIIIEKIFKFKQSNDDEEEENLDLSNSDSINEKNRRIIIPQYNNYNINNEDKLNLNRNTTINNTEATLISTLLSPNMSSPESINFNSYNNNNNNNKGRNIKNIKKRIANEVGDLNNSQNIEEEPKEESEDAKNNKEMKFHTSLNINIGNNSKKIFYDYDENVQDSNNLLNPKNTKFRGKRGLHISSLSFNQNPEINNNDDEL